jgi:hypothetical protein
MTDEWRIGKEEIMAYHPVNHLEGLKNPCGSSVNIADVPVEIRTYLLQNKILEGYH